MWACAWACLDALCQPLHGAVDKTVLEVSFFFRWYMYVFFEVTCSVVANQGVGKILAEIHVHMHVYICKYGY